MQDVRKYHLLSCMRFKPPLQLYDISNGKNGYNCLVTQNSTYFSQQGNFLSLIASLMIYLTELTHELNLKPPGKSEEGECSNIHMWQIERHKEEFQIALTLIASVLYCTAFLFEDTNQLEKVQNVNMQYAILEGFLLEL